MDLLVVLAVLFFGLGISSSVLWFFLWLDKQHRVISQDVIDVFEDGKTSEDDIENVIKTKTK